MLQQLGACSVPDKWPVHRGKDAVDPHLKHAADERRSGEVTPDFCIPDEIHPAVVIEAKLTRNDGTARDKVSRIKELETQRNNMWQKAALFTRWWPVLTNVDSGDGV